MIILANFILPNKALEVIDPIPVTLEERRLIDYLREHTPEDSVIVYNIPRYKDRPAVMSALSGRRSFISMAELLEAVYEISLEERIYDFWTLLNCPCGEKNPAVFFDKYPFVNYVVRYDNRFSKPMTPFGGVEDRAFASKTEFQKSPWFKPVFSRGMITLYKVER